MARKMVQTFNQTSNSLADIFSIVRLIGPQNHLATGNNRNTIEGAAGETLPLPLRVQIQHHSQDQNNAFNHLLVKRRDAHQV